MSPFVRPDALAALLSAVAALVRELRLAGGAVLAWVRPHRPAVPYETLSLELVLDLADPEGKRAVLTRRQRIRSLTAGTLVVRETVWGEGEQLARYAVVGARRLTVLPEGSRRSVLLDPGGHTASGDCATITSRRTIRGGFGQPEEYCETVLERPTGRVDFTVIFPRGRPPRSARLVLAATEITVRTVPVRYRPDGRAVLRCRLRRPTVATTYSLRWSW